jgi:predicted small metal-binding protein
VWGHRRVVGFAVEEEGAFVKSFACGDVVPGCEARWVCSTEDEILANVAAHAASAHGLEALPADVVQAVHKAIVPVS